MNKAEMEQELFEYAIERMDKSNVISSNFDRITCDTEDGKYIYDTFETKFKIPYVYLINSEEGDNFSGAITLENNTISIGIGDSDTMDYFNCIEIYIDTNNEYESLKRINRGVDKFIDIIDKCDVYAGTYIVNDKELDYLKKSWPYVDRESIQYLVNDNEEVKDTIDKLNNDKEVQKYFMYIEEDGTVHLNIIRNDFSFEDRIITLYCKTYKDEEEYREYYEKYSDEF